MVPYTIICPVYPILYISKNMYTDGQEPQISGNQNPLATKPSNYIQMEGEEEQVLATRTVSKQASSPDLQQGEVISRGRELLLEAPDGL